LVEAVVVSARRWAAGARRTLRRAARRLLEEPRTPIERNPDARAPMDTLDDWILFGPRLH